MKGLTSSLLLLAVGAAEGRQWPLYMQCDPRWGADKMGVDGPGERSTICGEGCAMSSLSMAMAGLGVKIGEQLATPGSFNQWLEEHHGYTCIAHDCNNLVLNAVEGLTPKLSLLGERAPDTEGVMREHLARGDIIYLAHVRDRGHFVLLTGWEAAKSAFTVNDPFYNVTTYLHSEIADVIAYAVHGSMWAAPSSSEKVELPSTAVVPKDYPMYKQCDPAWGEDVMVSTTICHVGCLMSSTAMALAGHHIAVKGEVQDATSTPGTLNAWLRTHNGYNGDNDLDESAVPRINPSLVSWPADGMHTKNDLAINEIHSFLAAGRPVIANVDKGHHFVLVIGYDSADEDVLYVNDPGFSRTTYSRSKDVVGWRLYGMKDSTAEAVVV